MSSQVSSGILSSVSALSSSFANDRVEATILELSKLPDCRNLDDFSKFLRSLESRISLYDEGMEENLYIVYSLIIICMEKRSLPQFSSDHVSYLVAKAIPSFIRLFLNSRRDFRKYMTSIDVILVAFFRLVRVKHDLLIDLSLASDPVTPAAVLESETKVVQALLDVVTLWSKASLLPYYRALPYSSHPDILAFHEDLYPLSESCDPKSLSFRDDPPGDFVFAPVSTRDNRSLRQLSSSFLPVVNEFGRCALFHMFVRFVRSRRGPLTLSVQHFEIFSRLSSFLSQEFESWFVTNFADALFRRSSAFEESDLRNVDSRSLDDLLYRIQEFATGRRNTLLSRQIDEQLMLLMQKYAESPILELRLTGLGDVAKLVLHICNRKTSRSKFIGFQWMEVSALIVWVKENHFLERIFDSGQVDLVKQSEILWQFLAREDALTHSEYLVLWTSCIAKHESLRRVVCNIILAMTRYLSVKELQNFFDNYVASILEHPDWLRSLDTYHMDFFETYTTRGLEIFASEKVKRESFSWFGIDLLWNLLQDDFVENVSSKIRQAAFDRLESVLHHPIASGRRVDILQECLKNIQNRRSLMYSMKLVSALIEWMRTDPKRRKMTPESLMSEVIQGFDIMSIFFADLKEYEKTFRKCGLPLGYPTPNEAIQTRLQFLETVLTTTSIELSYPLLCELWNVCYTRCPSPSGRHETVKWISHVHSFSQSSDKKSVFSTETLERFFIEKLCSQEYSQTADSLSSLSLFESFFLWMNQNSKRISIEEVGDLEAVDVHDTKVVSDDCRSPSFTVIQSEVIGADSLLHMALYSLDDSVALRAGRLFNLTRFRLGPNLLKNALILREQHLERIMSELSSPVSSSASSSNDSEQKISRVFAILRSFVAMFGECVQRHGGMMSGVGFVIRAIVINDRQFSPSSVGDALECRISVSPHDRVDTLLHLIADRIRRPSQSLRLFFKDRELTSSQNDLQKRLSECGIHDRGLIWVSVRDLKDVCFDSLSFLFSALGAENKAQSVLKRTLSFQGATAEMEALAASTLAIDMLVEESNPEPSFILSSPKYFNQFTELFRSSSQQVSLRAWELLMLLPTSRDLVSKIRKAASGKGDWKSILIVDNPFELLYSLQIIDSFTDASEDRISRGLDIDKKGWSSSFVSTGGLRLLLNSIFSNTSPVMSAVVSPGSSVRICDSTMDLVSQHCLSVLLRVIQHGLQVASRIGNYRDIVSDEELDHLIPLSLRVVSDISEAHSLSETASLYLGASAADLGSQVLRQALNLTRTCILLLGRCDAALFFTDDFSSWLKTILLMGSSSVRAGAADGLSDLLRTDIDATNSLASLLIPKLLDFLRHGDDLQGDVEPFFRLISRILGFPGVHQIITDIEELFHMVIQKLHVLPVSETEDMVKKGEFDSLLVGLLQLAGTLIDIAPDMSIETFHPHTGSLCDLLTQVFHDCLFGISSLEESVLLAEHASRGQDSIDRTKFPTSAVSPYVLPKCKSPEARLAGMNLLSRLSLAQNSLFLRICSLLRDFVHHTPSSEDFVFNPTGNIRSELGYAGLQNQGCTCYMNAMLQQIYMTPTIRNSVLSLDVDSIRPTDEDLDNWIVLREFQNLVGHLYLTNERFYKTGSFTANYKGWDGMPIDPREQQDANEFFNMMLDRLENALRSTEYSRLFRDIFGGRLVTQVICKDVDFVSSREEPFFSTSLEIKNQDSILRSLDLFVQGDRLEGENQYFVEEFNQKVDALKRTCFRELPPMLALHMKRFEFDMQTMQNIKINDRCEFPLTLDMYPYTEEALNKSGNPTGAALSSSFYNLMQGADEHDPLYYLYDLVGVLVHVGSANAGHYYSFIRERDDVSDHVGNWFEFNDTRISAFDPANLDRETFGGVETSVSPDGSTKTYTRSANAYMLFYRQKLFAKEHGKRFRKHLIEDNPDLQSSDDVVIPDSSTENLDMQDQVASSSSSSSRPSTRERSRSVLDTPKYEIEEITYKSSGFQCVAQSIAEPIWRENSTFMRQRWLFDETVLQFVWNMLRTKEKQRRKRILNAIRGVGVDPTELQNEEHDISEDDILVVTDLSLNFLCNILARSKSSSLFPEWAEYLVEWMETNFVACMYLADTIAHHIEWRQHLLLSHFSPEVRRGFAEIIFQTIRLLSPHCFIQYEKFDPGSFVIGVGPMHPDGGLSFGNLQHDASYQGSYYTISGVCLPGLVTSLVDMLPEAFREGKRSSDFFRILLLICEQCDVEREYLISREVVAKLVRLLSRELDEVRAFNDGARANANRYGAGAMRGGYDSQRVTFGPTASSAPLQIREMTLVDRLGSDVINRAYKILRLLVCSCATYQSITLGPPPTHFPPIPANLDHVDAVQVRLLSLSENDVTGLFDKSFISRSLEESAEGGAELVEVLAHWCWESMEITQNIMNMAAESIDSKMYTKYSPFFDLVARLIAIDDSIANARTQYCLNALLTLAKQNVHNMHATHSIVQFLVEQRKNTDFSKEWVASQMNKIEEICQRAGLRVSRRDENSKK